MSSSLRERKTGRSGALALSPAFATRIVRGVGEDGMSDLPGAIGAATSETSAVLAALFDRLAPVAYSLALRITGDRRTAELACERAMAVVVASTAEDRALEAAFLEAVREQALALAPTQASSAGRERTYLLATAVRAHLDSFEPAVRTALDLAYFGGMDLASIAAAVGTKTEELRPRLRAALLQLAAATRALEEDRS